MTNQDIIAFIKRFPVSFGCGAATLVLAGLLYFRSDAIPEAETLLTQKTAEAERYATNLKNSQNLKEQSDTLAEAMKAIDSRIVRVSKFAINSQYFYSLESESGVRLLSARQNTNVLPKGKTTFAPVNFGVTVQGELAVVLNFLRALENGTHYCRVLSASCRGIQGERRGDVTLTLQLELLGLP